MLYQDPYDYTDTTWRFPWKPYGKCLISTCLFYAVRCEFGFCQVCCGRCHGKIPNHIVPPAWQTNSLVSTSPVADERLPSHYTDKIREPHLGTMEVVKEMEKHTSFIYSDDPWYKI